MNRSCPRLEINTNKLRENGVLILDRCRARGIDVTVVTKVTCAHPVVVRTLVEADVRSLGDSRLRNLRRIRALAPDAELMLLRLPGMSQADDVVRWADLSLNSEAMTLRALDAAAERAGKRHGVILMVDMGDLREGVWPDELAGLCAEAGKLCHIEVRGVGTNLACYGGVCPTADNMRGLLDCRDLASEVLGREIPIVSGGNSANWLLLEAGGMPPGVNHLRIGEAIMLGNESAERTPIEGMFDDVFTVSAEVIEARVKPSVPVGTVGQDAFGRVQVFVDRGRRRRAIVAVGRQDVVPEGLRPESEGVSLIGASSDHMILDVEETREPVRIGDVLRFSIRGYSCLLAAFTSPYLTKVRA